MKPKPYCEICDGTGKIKSFCEYEDCKDPIDCHYAEWLDCPECEEVNDIENEQVSNP